ncbi:hypothetical protein SAMN04489860_1775 [Paraoerskovia marina]|uniref:Uncharacterized protein n=1 Tax=Paraoerskovia marina TaxID=545619 RepID=A0A1H1T2M6_9CELL|nr:hypothetical protein SAMN04489860_1775 [Paraoerskovia marina]
MTSGMVTCTLAVIAHRHGVAGVDDPTDCELVRRVRRGLRRILGDAPRRRARPLLVEECHRDLATLVNSYIRPITQMQTTSSRHLGM